MQPLAEVCQITMLTLLGLSGAVGLLALISPSAFAVVASIGGRRIQINGAESAQRWFDIDCYVIEHSRIFGLVIVGSEGLIWGLARFGPETYSKSHLLAMVGIVLLGALLTLGYVLRQKRALESNQAEAHTDPLTGIANRRAFDAELTRRIAQRQRTGTPLCLQIIDIDKFKLINDKFGHLTGDEILKEISRALVETAGESDTVARLGGDEFAVILLGSNLQAASETAEKFRRAVGASPIRSDQGEHQVTISCGLAEAQPDDDVLSLIRRADSALYAAKAAGRDCCFRDGGPQPANIAAPQAPPETDLGWNSAEAIPS